MQAIDLDLLCPQNASSVEQLSLDNCSKDQQVMLTSLVANSAFGALDEAVTARMKALGFIPGVRLTIIGFGLFGRDPLAVQINGTKFALRRAEAKKLLVIPL
jgi:ferrous iron transport protein A